MPRHQSEIRAAGRTARGIVTAFLAISALLPLAIPSGAAEIQERPQHYIGPNLNPAGLTLHPRKIGDGVYALLANQMPKDNNAVIIGDNAALVVDAGINSAVSEQIQNIVHTLTDKPIRYLANTTYHGDHTFGNAAFPASVTIISSEKNRESMVSLAAEKKIRTGNLRGNVHALDDVTSWRKPDVTFTDHINIDLGHKIVQLWYFGPGNAPGDTVVYVPSAKVAFTGNYLMAKGVPPMLLEGGTGPYIKSLEKMKATLDVKTIMPGHGPMSPAQAALDNFIGYMHELHDRVSKDIAKGETLEETIADYPMSDFFHAPPGVTPDPAMAAMAPHLHKLDVLAEYKALANK